MTAVIDRLEAAHKLIANVGGRLSLGLTRRTLKPSTLYYSAQQLRQAAKALDEAALGLFVEGRAPASLPDLDDHPIQSGRTDRT